MNILIIAHFQYDSSPYNRFVHDQAKTYAELGHRVVVLCPMTRFKGGVNAQIKGKSEQIIDGVKVYYVKHLSLSNYGKYGANNTLAYRAIKKMFLQIRRSGFEPDIIQAHMIGFEGNLAVRLKEAYGIPVVITTHGSDTALEIAAGKADYIVGICKRADAVVAVSSKLRRLLKAQSPELHVTVIHNGFESKNISLQKKTPRSIISVGHLIKAKNFDITLNVFRQVLAQYPDATLTIIGTGVLEESLKSLSAELNLSDSVVFTGEIANKAVLEQMGKSEVFLLPSSPEGLGIVYLEAMASGCFTIGTKGEGIEDIIRHEENGILIQPNNTEEIVKYILKAFEEDAYFDKIITNAMRDAAEYTWMKNAKANIALFTRLITR